ncbi:zinc-binding dehydrogenase [Microlunatus phosphovorus]|uniref:zinc-binding dehydrogenase n=1 Tax=Microlunatus phosphovorus TaxID=29405 RepID=UPI00155B37D0|nr:zinc-binding dehydrogenase [Microlunatus phosphovorus]
MRAYVGADQDSSPVTMTAVRHRRYGTPESLEIASGLPIPVAATDHVLVRVHAAGVSRGVVHMMTGSPILVLGASGGVGSFAVKLATRWGADVTAVCSARKARYVLEWGATRSFDYREGLSAALDDTYDVILDCAGGTPLARMRSSLQPYGTLVFVGNETGGALTGGYERPFAYQLRMTRHSQRFANLLVRTSPQDLDLLTAKARGGLRPHLHAVRPLAEVRESLNDLVPGRVVGKTALTLTETAHH